MRAEGEEGIRGWDGCMSSPMQWTWISANFRTWWGTGRPGVLQSMESQRVGHDWVTERQQLLVTLKKVEICRGNLRTENSLRLNFAYFWCLTDYKDIRLIHKLGCNNIEDFSVNLSNKHLRKLEVVIPSTLSLKSSY